MDTGDFLAEARRTRRKEQVYFLAEFFGKLHPDTRAIALALLQQQ